MRIIEMIVRNVKRIQEIEIRPNGDMVVISGKNNQGKTTALDCIFLAFGGGDASRAIDNVIRDGESYAEVEIDIGEYKVWRSWELRDDNSIKKTMKLFDADGTQIKTAPQKILNSLMAGKWFNPLAFSDMDEKEKVAELMRAIGKADELEQLDKERDELFDKRTDINRNAKSARAEANAIERYGDDVPDDEFSTADVVKFMQEAQEHIDANAAVAKRYDESVELLTKCEEKVIKLEKELASAITERDEQQKITIADKKAFLALEAPPDIADLQTKASDLDASNTKVRDKKRRLVLVEKAKGLEKESTDLTAAIEAKDKEKSDIVLNAELPVEGLDLGPDGVIFNGQTIKDCSESQRLRVSVAIGMALNPELRIMRITGGSVLDSDSLQMIREMAGELDYQVWIERVDDQEASVFLEDGKVLWAA